MRSSQRSANARGSGLIDDVSAQRTMVCPVITPLLPHAARAIARRRGQATGRALPQWPAACALIARFPDPFAASPQGDGELDRLSCAAPSLARRHAPISTRVPESRNVAWDSATVNRLSANHGEA